MEETMTNKELVNSFAAKVNWTPSNISFDGPYITFTTNDTHEKIVLPLDVVIDTYEKHYS